jgi:hypothetical protein
MKQLLTAITILITASILYCQPYEIPFNSKGNVIELSVNNTTNTDFNDVMVEVESAPDWIKFSSKKIEITKVPQSKEMIAKFLFDAHHTTNTDQSSDIKFKITTNEGREFFKTISIKSSIPDKFELNQNYPNPFNPTTKITFTLPKDSKVNLSVYNILGERVVELVNEEKKSGYYEYDFDGSRLASGMYIYKIQTSEFSSVKKMLLLK